MPIARETLDVTARTYVATMKSIRGRRVPRLLMREFARFDHVLAVVAADGTSASLALAEDGSAERMAETPRSPSANGHAWKGQR